MGGTEMRTLVAHAGKLFAGNGYWMDEPGPEGMQGAEILVLDRPGGPWRVDDAFEESRSDDSDAGPAPSPTRLQRAGVRNPRMRAAKSSAKCWSR